MKITNAIPVMSLAILVMACAPVDYGTSGEQITIAKAQKQITRGMSSADVVAILGSPNMVTTDDERRENWVYDKVSTRHIYSRGKFFFPKDSRSHTEQRSLTIIVKFDENSRVKDFAYRTTAF